MNLKELISKEYKIVNLIELSILEKRNIINEIYNKKNTSIRQLSRVFGVGKTIV